MSLKLPPPDKTQLATSPLALVVCQVQYEPTLVVNDGRTVLKIHDALGGRNGPYPKVEQLQTQGLDLLIGPGVSQAAPIGRESGWKLSSSDGRWSISILPSYASLETTRYTTWSDSFQPRLDILFEAIAEHVAPTVEQRLGLRYVDRITKPVIYDPCDWRGWIAPEFLGPVLHPSIGPAITASQQQVDIDAGDGIRCGIRHGFVSDPARDNASTYILDTDVYHEGIRTFDVEDIKATLVTFHSLTLQLFQQAVTPQMLEQLKGGQDGHGDT